MGTVFFSNQQVMLKKSKMTKILNSEENSIGKSLITWQNQMTKHIKRMDNNCHIPDSNIGKGIFRCRKLWIDPGFITLNRSLLRQSYKIPLCLQRCVNKTDITNNKIVKIWVQQSSLCYNLINTNIFYKKTQKHLSYYKHIHCFTCLTSENVYVT